MRFRQCFSFWLLTIALEQQTEVVGFSLNSSSSRENGMRRPSFSSAYGRFLRSRDRRNYADSSTLFTKKKKRKDALASSIEEPPQRTETSATRRSPGAPLVDSTLLRFLSTQKRQQRSFDETVAPEPKANPTSKVSGVSDEPTTASDNISQNHDAWLTQFNSNCVAKKLVDLGADENCAREAGVAVQHHALARTARRRIREFLKERDEEWVTQRSGNVLYGTFSQRKSSEPLQYGLDDIIEVCVQSGLTANDIAAVFAHTPSIALMMPRRDNNSAMNVVEETETEGETLEETITRSLKTLLCGSLGLRRYDARKVLRSCPGLLTKRGSRSAQHIVNVMQTLGVSARSIGRDTSTLPLLLSRSPSSLFRLISFLSSDAVRMPVDKIGPLIRRKQCADLLDAAAPSPRLDVAAHNGTEAMIASLWGRTSVQRRDEINNVYRRMSSTAWSLRNEIGCAELEKIISAYPAVLLLDAKTEILPTADFLMTELGLWEDDLPRVLQLYPKLLGYDISQMRKVVEFLMRIGVEESSLESIFRAFPYLLTLDVDNDMAPVVKFLRDIGISDIGRFVTRLPPVLGYSIRDELAPKLKYLTEVCPYSSFEIARFPAYFSYPLDRVIKCRYRYLMEVKGMSKVLLPVDRILRYGDKDFATKIAGDPDDGERFRVFSEERNREYKSERVQKRKKRKARKVF